MGFDTGCETELIDLVGHGMLVPPEDSKSLAEGIRKILMTSDGGRAMGKTRCTIL